MLDIFFDSSPSLIDDIIIMDDDIVVVIEPLHADKTDIGTASGENLIDDDDLFMQGDIRDLILIRQKDQVLLFQRDADI